MDTREQVKKLMTYAEDPQLALMDELQELNASLKELANKDIAKVSFTPDVRLPDVVNVKIEGVELIKGDTGATGNSGRDGRAGTDGQSIVGPPGIDGKTPVAGVDFELPKNGLDGKDGSPDSAEDIRSKLELLEGNERLKIEAIKNLREELDELKKRIASKIVYGGGGGAGATGGKIVKGYDLSASLNGVLKTFSLPAFWRIISVHSSSFPNAFRETVDYTVDGSAFTITFTSEITASSTLAAGQTITIVYAEP